MRGLQVVAIVLGAPMVALGCLGALVFAAMTSGGTDDLGSILLSALPFLGVAALGGVLIFWAVRSRPPAG